MASLFLKKSQKKNKESFSRLRSPKQTCNLLIDLSHSPTVFHKMQNRGAEQIKYEASPASPRQLYAPESLSKTLRRQRHASATRQRITSSPAPRVMRITSPLSPRRKSAGKAPEKRRKSAGGSPLRFRPPNIISRSSRPQASPA